MTATKSSDIVAEETTIGCEMEVTKTVGNNIRTLREQQGLSQAALAQKLGVCQQAVGKWERGASDPKWSLAPQLAVALHCSIDALFGRDPPGGPMDQ